LSYIINQIKNIEQSKQQSTEIKTPLPNW